MIAPTIQPADFSDNLFWDADPAEIDMERHIKYIVGRVLEFGTLNDWRFLCRRYTLSRVVEIARTLRCLDPKAVAFLSVVGGGIPRELFRCFTQKPLTATHWNC